MQYLSKPYSCAAPIRLFSGRGCGSSTTSCKGHWLASFLSQLSNPKNPHSAFHSFANGGTNLPFSVFHSGKRKSLNLYSMKPVPFLRKSSLSWQEFHISTNAQRWSEWPWGARFCCTYPILSVMRVAIVVLALPGRAASSYRMNPGSSLSRWTDY